MREMRCCCLRLTDCGCPSGLLPPPPENNHSRAFAAVQFSQLQNLGKRPANSSSKRARWGWEVKRSSEDNGCGLPSVRQEFVEPDIRLGGPPHLDIPAAGIGFMSVELGRLDQTLDSEGALAGRETAGAQPVTTLCRARYSPRPKRFSRLHHPR